MMRLLAVLAMLWPLAGEPASLRSGHQIMVLCDHAGLSTEAPAEPADRERLDKACIFYLLGVLDTDTAAARLADRVPHVCVPDDVSADQVRNVFVRAMWHHPEVWTSPASALVLGALRAVWPCE